MQIWFSAGINLCLAALFGFFLIENHLPTITQRPVKRAKIIFNLCLIFSLLGFLILATIGITQSRPENLLANSWAVIRLTILGNMVLLGLICSLFLLVLICISKTRFLYLAAIIILAYAKADIGHAADYGYIHWAIINHTLHILAGSAWAGSVIASIVLLGYWRKFNQADSYGLAQRLSTIATIAVPITLICGVIDGLRILYRLGDIWTSAYFITLTIKVLLVFIAIALGLINRWYWMPKMANQPGGFIQTITIESVGLILVLMVAAILGATMIPG